MTYAKTYKNEDGMKLNTREYSVWMNMNKRCDPKYHIQKPSYALCEVSSNFKDFQYFASWCNHQKGFREGYHLDKDVLIKGNKVYSEDACVFIPVELNSFLTKANSLRGSLPIGVSSQRSERSLTTKYRARVGDMHGKFVSLGCFHNPEDAFSAYKQEKEKLAKYYAAYFREVLDERVIEALNNYTVHIND